MFYVHFIMIIFTLPKRADPDEMQHFVALYLGLHSMSNNSSRGQWLNSHVQLSIVAQNGKDK